ncbi:MAG: hypothetical protein ACRDO9_09800 [Gaiellales bacterium]
MNGNNLLTTENLRKEFGGLVAVNDVDFTIPEGAIASLTSGSGGERPTT